MRTQPNSPFDAEAILDDVSRELGLTDFGPDDFRPGLDALVATYRAAPLTEVGVATRLRYLRRNLTTRLDTAAALTRHPEIVERDIPSPIYIVGLARTGTTFLHRMLAEAPGLRVLLRWEGLFPAPRADSNADTRVAAAASEGRDRSFDAIRKVRPDLPEEDYLLLEPSMRFASGGDHMWEPFGSWVKTADQRPAYEYLALLVRLLDWQRPAGRWLMKSPAHLGNLDQLVAQFPDVRLIWTHRDPLEAVPSLCSLFAKALAPIAAVDPAHIGASTAAGCVANLERAMAVRDAFGEERFVDVDYRELVGDPVGVAGDVADRIGLDVTPELIERFRHYAADHPQHADGVHRYDLSEFGLDAGDVRERVRSYTEHFGLPTGQ